MQQLCPEVRTPPHEPYESSQPREQYRYTKRPTTLSFWRQRQTDYSAGMMSIAIAYSYNIPIKFYLDLLPFYRPTAHWQSTAWRIHSGRALHKPEAYVLVQIFSQILSCIKISSTGLLALQCSKMHRDVDKSNIDQNYTVHYWDWLGGFVRHAWTRVSTNIPLRIHQRHFNWKFWWG